ncbi:uncharacterized protein LOC112575114 [Pomacea canaliculata]|uniref:uncharacterized protein LOC112575114 n=1 Tax=Pomacea canaliculata TaxID=400727 RepID=UPI000D731BEC|nr:uncharacterized protein LOC112575114 [Pomacea canaliculata]
MDNNQSRQILERMAAHLGVPLPPQLAPPLLQLAEPQNDTTTPDDNTQPRRAPRARLLDEQLILLEMELQQNQHPSAAVREEIATLTGTWMEYTLLSTRYTYDKQVQSKVRSHHSNNQPSNNPHPKFYRTA